MFVIHNSCFSVYCRNKVKNRRAFYSWCRPLCLFKITRQTLCSSRMLSTSAFLFRFSASASVYSMSSTSSLPESSSEHSSSGRELLNSVGWEGDIGTRQAFSQHSESDYVIMCSENLIENMSDKNHNRRCRVLLWTVVVSLESFACLKRKGQSEKWKETALNLWGTASHYHFNILKQPPTDYCQRCPTHTHTQNKSMVCGSPKMLNDSQTNVCFWVIIRTYEFSTASYSTFSQFWFIPCKLSSVALFRSSSSLISWASYMGWGGDKVNIIEI